MVTTSSAEVAAAGEIRLRESERDGLRLLDHLGGEAVPQVMLADHDFDVDAEVVRPAEDFDHAADSRFAGLLRVFEDLDVDDHAVHLAHVAHLMRRCADAVHVGAAPGDLEAFGDDDPLLDAGLERNDVAFAPANPELAGDSGMRAAENAHHLAFSAAVGVDAGDAGKHGVAVHGVAGGVRRDENVSGDAGHLLGWSDEAVALAVHGEAAGGELLRAARKHILASAQPR